MATQTWYLVDGVDAAGWQSLSTSTQSAATTAAGWIVSTGSTNHSELFANTERAASTFTGTTVPDGTLDTTNKDAFRSPTVLSGSFASANWVFQFAVRSPTQGGAADGRIRFRLIAANADGTGATEITSGQQQASLVSNVDNAGDFNTSLTFNPGAFTVSGQYLFIQVAWERTGAGGMTSTNIRFRTGSAATPTGTVLVTSDFTPDPIRPPFWTNPILRISSAIASTLVGVNLLTTTLAPLPLPATYTTEQTTLIFSQKAAQTWAPQNLLQTTLTSAPAQAPFYQTNWQNPPRLQLPRIAQDPPNLLSTTLAPVSGVPFVQGVWANPVRRAYTPAVNVSTDSGEVVVKPFRQRDWQNPSTVRRGPVDRIQPYNLALNTPAGAAPFKQTVWTNPPSYLSRLLVTINTQPGEVPPTPVVTDPFHQTDWPNPRGKRPVPQAESSGGDVSFQLVLYRGVDLGDMFALPQRKAIPTSLSFETRSFAIAAGGNPVPFHQLDWPGGRALPRPVFQPASVINTLLQTAQAPFRQVVWPNPIVKAVSVAPQQEHNFPISALGNPVPFSQVNWTIPRVVAPQQPHIFGNIGPLNAAAPTVPVVNGSVLDLPVRRVFVPDHQEHRSFPLAVFGNPVPFNQTNWPGYTALRFPAGVEQGKRSPNLDTPLGTPFSQTAWPNPIRAIRATLVNIGSEPNEIEVLPFSQLSWPNPIGKIGIRQDGSYTSFTIRAAGNPVPFHQLDWPVTPAARRAGPVEPSSILNTLLQTVQAPFQPTVWPNPRVATSSVPAQQEHNFPISTLGNLVPFGPFDWGTQKARVVVQQATLGGNIRPLTAASPVANGSVLDLPIRRVLVPEHQEHRSFPLTTLGNPVPFNQLVWPSAAARPPLHLGIVDRNDTLWLVTNTGSQPFRQTVWPLTTAKAPLHVGYVDRDDPLLITYGNPVPFNQTIWPLTYGKSAVPVGVVDRNDTLWLVSNASTPFHQTEWPLILRKQPPTVGFVDRDDTLWLASNVLPFRQAYWPNPASRNLVSIDWLRNALALAAAAEARPFYQLDWPLALRRQPLNTGIASRDDSIWIVPEPGVPFSQMEWPLFLSIPRAEIFTITGQDSLALPYVFGRAICLLATEELYDLRATLELFDLNVDGSDCC